MEGVFEITESTRVSEILAVCPSARGVLDRHGLHGCGGGQGPGESLGFFARVHAVDLDALLKDLMAELENPSKLPAPFQASLGDAIYRPFFKAGIAVVLTLGALWGATSLFQIALAKELLQPRLIPAIHAHAHAMIFGWVGLFVMGFAYQSFPRFKHTTLWRPRLAHLTLYLMLGGILTRGAAEMLIPGAAALFLGGVAAVSELGAIGLFVGIIFKTARASIEPHNRYEIFIFTALAWFFVQAVASDVFFFATATARSLDQLVHRLALLDAPLRDIQLLGFTAMIIAGVSQRFLPVVYALAKPSKDRQAWIYALMNFSLVLDVVYYVGLIETGRRIFAVGLEVAYFLGAVWALLLVRQLGVFSKPTESDRSWKFVRAAYVWLLVAMAMMPMLAPYSRLTGQGFSHAFWGSQRHAFTVGFVSLMIVGVAARVVPILAAQDLRRASNLWGPFVLLNAGCAGRVALEILTDFRPGIAYGLIGLTGFMEFAGLAWWGVDLWRAMNLSRARRTVPLLVSVSSARP